MRNYEGLAADDLFGGEGAGSVSSLFFPFFVYSFVPPPFFDGSFFPFPFPFFLVFC